MASLRDDGITSDHSWLLYLAKRWRGNAWPTMGTMGESEVNYYQALTTPTKLRGGYYTPDALVALILERLELRPDDVVIDPSCGDGSFLRGAVAAAARGVRASAHDEQLATHWARRIIGFDIDGAAVAAAREAVRDAFARHFAVELAPDALQVHRADLLACSDLEQLVAETCAAEVGERGRQLVVGNPPYVEAKRLSRETKEALRDRFPDAVVGAPDLYLYFLHVCLGWLREGDALAFVLPNKVLVNANARQLRGRILHEGRLRGLWFATRTGIFEDAAVYPVVLFAGGTTHDNEFRPTTNECQEPGASVEVVALQRSPTGEIEPRGGRKVAARLYGRTRALAWFPVPEARALAVALERLLDLVEATPLDGVLDIRWTISFHRSGLRERFVTRARPEESEASRFLGGGPFMGNGEVTRYRIDWAGWWIRYDAEGLKAIGNSLPDPSLFERPKIVICQNGRTLRAAYDDQGFALKDTFLCGAIREVDHPLCRHPRALVGVLCSRAVHFFYAHVFYGGHVNGGYLHFLRSFLIDVPVGAWTDADAEAVAALVQRRERASTAEERIGLEERIEAHVGRALGLTPEEQEAIAAWAAADANWQARERVRAPVSRNVR
jgi:predicted RNA methylase